MGTWVPNPPKKTVFVDSPWLTVKNRFELSTAYAESSFGIAEEFIAQLETLLSTFEVPESSIADVDIPDLEPLSYENRPALGELTLPKIPSSSVVKPVWTSVPDFVALEFPDFNVKTPEYESPEKPEHDSIPDIGDSPTISDIIYPTKPDFTIPSAPVLADIEFPSPPSVTIPTFEGVTPSETWNLPASFNYSEAEYSSDIWADLFSKVLNDIRNGGTGLGATVETELYNRALLRQEAENERFYQEIEGYFEARGHSLPPGALAGRLYEAGREITRNNLRINSEITISQAELAQRNTQFMVDKGVQLEGMLRDFFNSQANRAFEASKVIVQTGIDIFNSQVNKYNARINAYQAQASVYESRVRAALTQIEVYRGQLEACRVISDVQRNLIEVYRTRIAAFDTYVRLYATEMEATRIKADIERARLETFRLQIETYVARLEADKAKFDVYVREIEGERTKAQMYSEQVRAYLGRIEAIKAESDIQMQTSELALKENQVKAEQYRAELSGYETQVRAATAEISSMVEGFRVEAMAYSAETEAEGNWLRAKAEEMRVRVENAKTKLDKAKAEITAAIQGFLAVKELQVKGTEGVMNVGAQLCASSLNAVTASASLGYSGSESNTETWSHGESITESHPYEPEAA